MTLNLYDIIAIAAAILVIILVIRFIKKSWSVIVTFLIITILGLYIFVWGFSRNDKFALYTLQEKYCKTEADSIKCHCILKPLIEELEDDYSEKEISAFTENAIAGSHALAKVIKNNAANIKSCLKDKESSHLWEEFQEELIKSSVEGMKQSLQLELKKNEEQQ